MINYVINNQICTNHKRISNCVNNCWGRYNLQTNNIPNPLPILILALATKQSAFVWTFLLRDRDGTCDKQLGFASFWKDWRNYSCFPIKLPI